MVTFNEAKSVVDAVVEVLNPISVVVFGSVAREGRGADLDLLIVTDSKPDNNENVYMLLHKCLNKFVKKFAVDPFIIPLPLLREYYSRGSPFLRMVFKEGKGGYMRNGWQEWLKQAREELTMAGYLLSGGYFRGACYHAQQAIEKAIKTMLLKKGWDLEKTHSVERLIAVAEEYKIKLDVSDEEIVFIDSVYRGRYPIEAGLLPLGEPTETDAEKAISIAERFMGTFIKV